MCIRDSSAREVLNEGVFDAVVKEKLDECFQGKVVRYLVEMAPTSNVFAAGDRIRVDIQPIAENYLDSARTGGLGTLRVLHGGRHASSILLPLIPHRCQLGVAGSDGVQVPHDCAGPTG